MYSYVALGVSRIGLWCARNRGPTRLFVRSLNRQTLRMSRSLTRLKERLKKRLRALACHQSQIAGKDHADYLQCSPNEALLVLEQVIELSDGNCIRVESDLFAPHQSRWYLSR